MTDSEILIFPISAFITFLKILFGASISRRF